MKSLARPAVVFVLSSVVSAGVLLFTDEPDRATRGSMVAAASVSEDYRLPQLRLLRSTVRHVRESYVEPARVDPERMYVEALEAVERRVPETMFRREGERLVLHLGTHRDVFEVPRVERLDRLVSELRRVAGAVQDHLDPRHIDDADDHLDPLAMVEYAMVNGMLATLDPHSMLLPPAESKEMDVENSGEFGGLGITIEMLDGRLTVDHTMPGTPADEAGLRGDDHIRRIDGEPTINMSLDEAIELLRGPVGAPVVLEIVRRDVADPFDVVVERDNIKLSPVEAYGMPGGYAYARIRTFHASAASDLEAELGAVAREEGGLRGLVLDLRDNPGGYLNQAVAVSDLFLSDGEIVSTRGPHDTRPAVEEARSKGTQDPYPIVVLVNANSASASEIVAGALRNNERAVIVGERTFGKGSVQNLHAVEHASKLKITIAQYLTPGERSIQSVGIPADVALVPAVVGPRQDTWRGEVHEATLYSRDRAARESDLADHLVSSYRRDESALYTVRYHRPWDLDIQPFDAPDPTLDRDVAFALDLLAVAPSAHRADMLAAAGPMLARRAEEESGRIEAAFRGMDVDWRDGPAVEEASVEVQVDLGEAEALVAGEPAEVTLSVTNTGEEDLFRVVAVAEEHDILEGYEFFLGRVPAGGTVSASRWMRVDAGYPSEIAPLTLSLRDTSEVEVASIATTLAAERRALPTLAWRWSAQADEDGRIDVGDVVRIDVEVRNEGEGPTRAAFARLKNGAGRALDILSGTLEPGTLWGPDGGDCPLIEPGWEAGAAVGDPSHPRVLARRAPRWDEDCTRVLEPGDTWSGTLEVEVLEPLKNGYELTLTLGDGEAYDWASIYRGGFYTYYRQEETLGFSLGPSVAVSPWRRPPDIQVTREPPLQADHPLASLSGVVEDDDGLSHVLVFAGDDKVFYQGEREGTPVTRVPFSADIRLEPGKNTVHVLAEDARGQTSSVSRVVYLPEDPGPLAGQRP